MNDFFVYILKCNDGSYYIGHTDNIEKRIAEHNFNEYPCYTSTRLPISVVFVQSFGTRDKAFIAERQMKKWSRKKKEALIEGDWKNVSLLSKKKFNKDKVAPFDTFLQSKKTQGERVGVIVSSSYSDPSVAISQKQENELEVGGL